MRTYRGVVCEKKDVYYVFLTGEGEFLRGTPLVDDPVIGAEVEFQVLEAGAPFLLTQIKPKILAPVLVAAVVLIFFVASLIPQQNSAYAYVQLEGERAVEIGVDEEGNVFSLRSLDDDIPLDVTEWEDLTLAAVLVHAVKHVGAKQDELVITTVYEKEANPEVKSQVEQAVKEVQAVQTEQKVNVKESSAEERKRANEEKTSIQKYKQKEQKPVKENKTGKEQPSNTSVDKPNNTNVEQPNNSVEKPVVPSHAPAATDKREKEKKEQPNKDVKEQKNKSHNPENKPNPNQSKEKQEYQNKHEQPQSNKHDQPKGKNQNNRNNNSQNNKPDGKNDNNNGNKGNNNKDTHHGNQKDNNNANKQQHEHR
ncbi:anti-sigma factor domain-containing protein [Psychrobacillus sp. FSL K6-1267]|uniref:anti-sigma factor domain-containing protein n=1 Tax=Psychrobacillus sp. FSL K6-1267 TaxID=2921543 RepID=UPI0030FB412F